MFNKKQKSRSTLWASIIGIVISAAVFAVRKGNRNDFKPPLQNIVRSLSPKSELGMSNAALAEFSEELLSSALKNDRKM
jgi:hypothetical protein